MMRNINSFVDLLVLIVIIKLMVPEVVSLSQTCSIEKKTKHECFYPFSWCNKRVRRCECSPNYSIGLWPLNACVGYQKLGDYCVYSMQCSKTFNAICVDKDSVELNSVESLTGQLVHQYYISQFGVPPLLSQYFIKSNKSQNGYKTLGRCQCKDGFKPMNPRDGNGWCQTVFLNKVICLGSHECLNTDPNSHCDARNGRCLCDSGYIYDTDSNKCQPITKHFGDFCNNDIECQMRDSYMNCRYSQCLCQKGLDFDFITQRCKQSSKEKKKCGLDYRWDDSVGDCEPLYDVRPHDYRFFSANKILETIVIVIFCCVTIALMRFWRNILPQHIWLASQDGMITEFTHTNRVARRRSSRNALLNRSNGRVIQLRVNLDSDSPETQYLSDQTFVELPLTASHSSLPPYEVANNISAVTDNESQPPPYSEDPPTYDEAMALSQTNQINYKEVLTKL
ncbi:uncharacterized protein LOC128960373 [Oppia nitens]|uniref:uncharacterized protein LOC128960373 n=1 Tax=Oppia nitens TaxID=1686743 RepID=UPI0023DC270D|nr:uncharacterized protein LOC128960373 [Oppia nitens]